jgi:hypothetical protein
MEGDAVVNQPDMIIFIDQHVAPFTVGIIDQQIKQGYRS